MLDFVIDNIFGQFGGLVFQHMIGIPMVTNWAPLIAGMFLHAYEADLLYGFRKNKDWKLAQTFNSNFHNIEDVLSLNNTLSKWAWSEEY